MSIVKHTLLPGEAQFLAANFPQLKKFDGSNFPVSGLAFDASTDEQAFWNLIAQNYGSGNVTVRVFWYADTASANDVVWDASLAVVTFNADTQDIETKAFAGAVSVTDSHLGTVGHQGHFIDIAISGASLDSLAADDQVWLRLNRDANNGADTMTGDAIVTAVEVSYSDT